MDANFYQNRNILEHLLPYTGGGKLMSLLIFDYSPRMHWEINVITIIEKVIKSIVMVWDSYSSDVLLKLFIIYGDCGWSETCRKFSE